MAVALPDPARRILVEMRRTGWISLVVLIAGCGRIGFDPELDPWIPGYERRKPITITPVAASRLAEIPISIAFDSDPELAATAEAEGRDLVFADRTGTVLSSELVRFDAALGTLDAWVTVPELGPDEPSTIYLYYGGAPALRTTPWSPTFAGVWHMELAGNTVLDSAGGHQADAELPAFSPVMTPGVVGRACDFDGIDDNLLVGDPPDDSLDVGLQSFSYSTWVYVTTSVDEYDTPFHKGGSSPGNPGFDFELGTGPWDAVVSDGTVVKSVLGDEADLRGRWTHLVAVIDREADRFLSYANGALGSAMPLNGLGSLDTTRPLRIGRDVYFFRGQIDEPRLYRRALTADWIATEYANLAERDTMIAIGDEQRWR